MVSLGIVYAMAGRPDEGRDVMHRGRAGYRDLGLEVTWAGAAMGEAWVELYSGDLVRAEAVLREGIEELEGLGERSYLSTTAVLLAQVLNEQGRFGEAERWTQLAREAGAADDMATQIGWRSQLARALARRGELEEVERLAHEGVELAEATDGLDWRGEALFALAEVMGAAGRREEAVQAATRALAEWERKGIVGYIERAQKLLAELSAQPPAMA